MKKKLSPPVDENNPAPIVMDNSAKPEVEASTDEQAAQTAPSVANAGYSLVNRDDTVKPQTEEPTPAPIESPQQTETPTVIAATDTQPASDNPSPGYSLINPASEQTETVVAQQNKPISKPDPVNEQVSTTPAVAEDEKAQPTYHEVVYGDTLFEISLKYNIKMRRLLQWNDLQENSNLKVGSKVYLEPSTQYHIIDKGDTLYAISLKYNILLANLLRWNNLAQDARLLPGQKVLIAEPQP